MTDSNRQCPSCNDLLQMGFAFCPKCGASAANSMACPDCGYENETNSKYCQECGRALKLQTSRTSRGKQSTKVATSPEVQIPRDGIAVEFGFSTSRNYELAVREAEKHATHAVFGEGKHETHVVQFMPDSLDSALALLELTKGWRSVRVYVDGEQTTYDAVFAFRWCFANRQAAYRAEHYCFGLDEDYHRNVFGCRMADAPFREYADWFGSGQFIDKKGTWQFDKKRIRHDLETRLFPYRFCPAIKLDLVEDVLNAIPDTVNPRTDRGWKFREGYERKPGCLVAKRQEKIHDHGAFSITTGGEEIFLIGVDPDGIEAIQSIADKLKRHRLPTGIGQRKPGESS